MKKYYINALVALSACLALVACSDNDEPVIDGTVSDSEVAAYVIAAQSSGASGTAAYLVTATDLSDGMVTTLGNGFETAYTSATTWIFYGNKYLYRLAYNYGSAGTTAAYYLDANGMIKQRAKEYNILNFTTYGIYKDKIIAADASSATDTKDAQGNAAYGVHFSVIDVEAETTGTKTLITEDFLGNKERVMFAGLLEANGKIYTAVVPLGLSPYGVAAGGVRPGYEDLVASSDGGSGGGQYIAGTLTGTQYPDECWVAVFDDDTFTNPTLIRTDGVSWAAGRMRSAYYQTIWAADNGDVYVFSPSFAKSNSDARQKTTLNSGVMRIKSGATAFDSNYAPFDIEQVSGGNAVYRCWHITADYFLLQMYTQGLNVQGTGTTMMAIYKGDSREFKYVSGLPDPDVVASFSKTPYTENGYCYTTVVTTDGAKPTIYKIDPVSATATAGLAVEADEIGAIGKLINITE
ncbi:MAG: DUF4374 domain-containing protein [Muribaculaceae bacterium]